MISKQAVATLTLTWHPTRGENGWFSGENHSVIIEAKKKEKKVWQVSCYVIHINNIIL